MIIFSCSSDGNKPVIQLKKLPSTNLKPMNKLSITYHTLTKLQKPPATLLIRLKMLFTGSLV